MNSIFLTSIHPEMHKTPSPSMGEGWGGGENGFTLLEVIITLVVASILGVLLYQFMGTSLTQSSVSVVRVQDQFELNGVKEKMNADHSNLVPDTISLDDFKEDVENNTPYYGGSFGDYTYVEESSGYITFDVDGNETPGGNSYLKVTIKKGEQTLTKCFPPY